MARRRRLAPKIVMSSGKFVAAVIVSHEGAWLYSEERRLLDLAVTISFLNGE